MGIAEMVCDRIRALREDSDRTQREIAGVLGVGQRTYCDYESGKTRIPMERLLLLAKYYSVSMDVSVQQAEQIPMDYICGASDMKRQFPKE